MTREQEIHKAYKKHLLNEGNPSKGFEYGARWADAYPVNPWHKASEELPPYDKVVIVAYDGNTDDCCFNHRSNNPEVKTSENGWCDIGYDTVPTHWMYIPEIKED